MAKVIAEKASNVTQPEKQVEIKHLRTMKDEAGKDVTVVDRVENKLVDDAIAQAEAKKASLEASLVEVEADLAEYIAIRDAE
tara:strand:- start:150 stop:395 length:246 start_codon:yes stop_codon:yes gene_type:complete